MLPVPLNFVSPKTGNVYFSKDVILSNLKKDTFGEEIQVKVFSEEFKSWMDLPDSLEIKAKSIE